MIEPDAAAADTSFSRLLAEPGVTEEVELRSAFGFMAFHGGHLEAETDRVASRAAQAAGASYYAVLHPEELDLHLPSTSFHPSASPAMSRFLDHVEVVVTVHGYGRRGRWTTLLAGGSNRALAEHLATHLRPALPDYEVVTDLDDIPTGLRGLHARNPVNLPRHGGVQLELPPRVRGCTPASPPRGPDGLCAPTRDLVAGLAAAAVAWPTAAPVPG